MKINKYTVVKERDFDREHLSGFEELNLMLETKGWVYLNKLIKETHETIGFEFCGNTANQDSCE